MIVDDLIKLNKLLECEIEILKNDLNIYQTTMKNIFSLQTVDIDGHHLVSMDQIIKICQNNFKLLSNKIKNNQKN